MAEAAIAGLFDEPEPDGAPPIDGLFEDSPVVESAALQPTSLSDSGSPNDQPEPQFIDGLFGGPALQPEPVEPTAPLEAALHLITGTPAMVVGTAAGIWETLMKGDARAFDPAREAASGGVLSDITYEPRGKGAQKMVEQIGRAFQGYSEVLNELAQTEEDLMGPGSGAPIKIAGELAPFLVGGVKGKGKARVEPEVKPPAEAPPPVAPQVGPTLEASIDQAKSEAIANYNSLREKAESRPPAAAPIEGELLPPMGNAEIVLDALKQGRGIGSMRMFSRAREALPDMPKADFDAAVLEIREANPKAMMPSDMAYEGLDAKSKERYVEDPKNQDRGRNAVYMGVNLDELAAPKAPEAPRAAEATKDGILPDDSAPPAENIAMAAAREDAGIPPVGSTEAAAPTMALDLRNGAASEHVAVGVERANENLVQAVVDDISNPQPEMVDVNMKTAATAGKARAKEGGATPSGLTALSSPSHLAEKAKFRKLKPYREDAKMAMRNDRKYKAHYNEKFNEVERALSPGKERLLDFGRGLRARRQEMNDLLLEQSLDPNVTFTRESLTARGIEPKVINGFFKMQNLYKAGFRMNNIIRKKQGLEPLTARKNYVHHLFGNYFVVAREAGGQPRVLSSFDSLRAATEAADQAKAPGLEVGVQIKTPQFNDLNRNAQVLGDKNFFALRSKIQKDLELTADEAHELLQGITRPRAKGRAPGFLKFRENKPGWMTDMDHVHRTYFNNLSRHMALDPFKRTTTARYEKDFGPPEKAEGLGAYVKKYMEDVNGVPHASDIAWNKAMLESPLGKVFEEVLGPTPFNEVMRGTGLAVSTLKLGNFNVGAAMVNATQFLGAHAVLGPVHFTKGFARGLRQLSYIPKQWHPKDGVRYIAEKDMSPSARKDRRLLREMGIEYGADNIAQLSEGTSNIASKGMRKVGKALQDSMALFTGMEYLLRTTTALGAYHKAIAAKMPHEAAIKYAADINDRVNFDYSVADAGTAFRSGAMMNEVLRFKKFPVKYTEFMRGLSGAEHFKFWVPYLALSGIWGLPGTDALGQLIEFATGYNPVTAGKEAIATGDVPDWLKEFDPDLLNYGAPALAGIDVSKRTGQGDVIPNELMDFVPVLVSSGYKGLQQAAHQNWSEALKQITPAPVNIYEAIENDQMFTPWDRMFVGSGFRPLEKSKSYDANTYKRMTQDQKSEFRDDYGRAVAKGTPQEQSEAWRAAREAGVTRRSLRNEAKQNRK